MNSLITKLRFAIYDINYNFKFFESAIHRYSNHYKSKSYKKRVATVKKQIDNLKMKYQIVIELNNNNEHYDDELKSKYSELDLFKMYFNIMQDSEFTDKILYTIYENRKISYLESELNHYLENVEYV